MNPAKAAPSAPVKQAVREDPQILPDGLLILFFLLLAVGEAVQRHHNQHEKADEHHGQGGHPGRKMKYRGIRTLDLSDANRTLSHADLKEAPKGQNISLRKRQKI
jgi:hypothetical protein